MDDGALADDFLVRVGTRIRSLRIEQSLTVQELADRAGISRRLLTQIEHGQANPSLVSITRLARQLGTESTELLADRASPSPIATLTAGQQVLVWSSAAGSSAHLLASTAGRTADLWRWKLLPGDSYHGHADPPRSQELFVVTTGTLTLEADELQVVVPSGGSARLDSDRPYVYRNAGPRPCTFIRTVALGS
ncbi:helix-turn-helix domain-containing protein [Demetria terragena]|uniref:helix-turn-helix domain-containing protein n=1 Tax=Demetria terragena TaxID=63959 RepID=UPI00036393D8|nr:XRE family transcriptional regulator [Demetria terragena]